MIDQLVDEGTKSLSSNSPNAALPPLCCRAHLPHLAANGLLSHAPLVNQLKEEIRHRVVTEEGREGFIEK